MLACLPGPGDLSLQLLPHSQMNTGLQKWDTTQRMRSTQYPTPAELDAYAKKVANSPLTIKIFPNSVKVPQRNHVRRTVNGLDAGGARYSPYPPSQSAAKAGLLAIVKAPITKGIIKDFTGTRVTMSAPGSGYGPAPSTLTLQHAPQPLHRPPQHQQALPQHSQSLQPLQQQQQQQQQHQGLGHHMPSAMPQHPQGMSRTQPLSHPPPLGHPGPQPPPALLLQQQQHLQQPPPGLQGGARKLTDADAPPNVTVSTSTIPLSMAGTLHQGRQADLSTIVHQINQFCQSRAQGAGATSMCEGQIANPSPISRNLLINASSRVAMHSGHSSAVPPGLGHSTCTTGAPDKSVGTGVPLHNMGAINRMAVYHNDLKQQHLQHQPNPQQHQICHHQQMMSWNQHQLAHLQHVSDGSGHSCKTAPRDPGFPCKGMNYPPELCIGQPYTLKPPMDKPTPSPPVVNNNTMPPGTVAHYANGQYYHQVPVWGSILPTPNSDSSGSQELPAPFHCPTGNGTGGTNPTPGVDCAPTGGTAHYRAAGVAVGQGAAVGQTNLMQTADYLGGDFQTPCFRDQNLGLMGKMPRPPPMAHGQHPGYR